MAYTKLHASIIASTVWRLPHPTRIVWITMLAMADRDGIVEGSVPGLADMARVTIPEVLEALKDFASPDEYSRTKDNEGRRIECIEGGWRILNYESYREKLSVEDQKRNAAERAARYRERKSRQNVMKQGTSSRSVTDRHASSQKIPKITVAEAEAEAEADTEQTEHTQSAPPPVLRKVQEHTREIEQTLPIVCVPPKQQNGGNGLAGNIERFISLYPGPVNDLAAQYFVQIVKTPQISETLFRNLESWKGCEQWKRGVGIKAAKNWLSEGDWKIAPKDTLRPLSGAAKDLWIANQMEITGRSYEEVEYELKTDAS